MTPSRSRVSTVLTPDRSVAVAIVALLVLGAVVIAPVGYAAAQEGNATAAPNGTATPAATATATPTSTASVGGPKRAASARIIPVQFNRDFVGVTTAEQGKVYNTSGPWAMFSISERVDQAQVREPGARVQILEGGNQIMVVYDSDAAPVGKPSLYHLDLYFTDGSARTLSLYASRTDVEAGSSRMTAYRPVIIKMLNDAEDAGHPRSPEGLEAHYTDLQETAQLLESLLTQQAIRAVTTAISWLRNPIGLAVTLVSIALISLYLLKRRKWALDVLANDSGKAQRLRERLWLEYKRQQQVANDERLSEVPEIDGSRELYWKDAFGVETVAGLAELFRSGVPVEDGGEVKHVGGIDDLEPENIREGWLEPVLRQHRITAPKVALGDGKAALQRMISKYGMGHIYQDAYQSTRELIDDLDESQDMKRRLSVGDVDDRVLDGPGGSGTATGGDD